MSLGQPIYYTIYRNAGDLGDRLHLLDIADGHLGYPEGAGHVGPLLASPRALHGPALVGAELARRLDAQGAGATQPGAAGDISDAVTGLVHAYVALVTKHHLVRFL